MKMFLRPLVAIAVSLASIALPAYVNGLGIKEVQAPVALKDIQFDLQFTVTFDRTDEGRGLDTLLVTVSDVQDNTQLKATNFSVYDSNNQRQTTFVLSGLILRRLGIQTVSLDVSLFNNNATGLVDPQGNPQTHANEELWVIPGGYTLFPLAVTMLIAIFTRNVLPALFCGVLTASFFIYQFSLPTAFARSLDLIILTSLTDPNNQLVILFAMIMGGFVNMVNDSGGSIGLANSLAVFAKSGRSTQFVTLFFGLLIFFDDYASALILGATLRTVADNMSVSREKFSFLVDSGAAPIAALIPITSWTAFESALLQVEADKLIANGIDLTTLGYETSGFLGLLRMLKYAYYSIYLLFFQVFIIGTGREFGPMFLAERRALLYGVSDERYGLKTPVEEDHDEDHVKPPPRCCNAGIPILFFVLYTIIAMVVLGAAAVPVHEQVGLHNIFANVDSITVMYYGAILATFLAALLYRIQYVPTAAASLQNANGASTAESSGVAGDGRVIVPASPGVCARILCCRGSGKRRRRPLMSCTRSIESFVQGFTHLTSTIMVLVLAWSIGSAVDYIGAGRFLATSLEGNVPPESLPVLIFLIACIVAFCTGSSWATMAVLYPICGPIAFQMSHANAEIYYCSMAAILEGSVFGDHCSFISDTTIMSAMACRCPLTAHVVTQLPYAFFCAAVCLSCGYLPIGMQTLSVAGTYFLGFFVTAAGILLLGAKPNGHRLDALNWAAVQLRTSLFRTNPDHIEAILLMRIPIGAEQLNVQLTSTQSRSKTESSEKKTLRRPSFETEQEDVENRRHLEPLEERVEEQTRVRRPTTKDVNPFDINFEISEVPVPTFQKSSSASSTNGEGNGGTLEEEGNAIETEVEHRPASPSAETTMTHV